MQHIQAITGLQPIRDAIANWDASVFRFVNTGLATRWLDMVMLSATTLGEGWLHALIALVVIAVGCGKRRVDLRQMGYAALTAYATSGLVSQFIKGLGDRPRPILVMFDVRLVGKPLFIHSFPSGHTTTAFAAAFVWAAFLPRYRWVLYSAAALVAISRVYVGVHFPVDVIYGAILGALLGTGSARMFPVRSQQGQEDAAVPDSLIAEEAS